MLRYSRSLPIGKFFAYSSVLIAILAVVLAGKGTAALQEAGLIDITPVAHVPRLSMLGIFPSLQPLLLQFLALAILWLGFWYNGRKHAAASAAAELALSFPARARGPQLLFCGGRIWGSASRG